MKHELIKLLVESIDIEKLAIGLIEGLGEQAIKDAAAKSPTPIDDAALAMILPAINPALEELIKKKVAELKAKILE